MAYGFSELVHVHVVKSEQVVACELAHSSHDDCRGRRPGSVRGTCQDVTENFRQLSLAQCLERVQMSRMFGFLTRRLVLFHF